MDSPIVTVKQGKLRGKVYLNQEGEEYFAFHSIPYSEPPARFQEGNPPKPWTGIRDATEESGGCYSRCVLTGEITGSEDCLYLNVYTKQLPKDDQKLRAVMVWIHGGSYVSGHTQTYLCGPNFLLTEDIVLVTVNYRLGVIGFLNFEDNTLPAVRNLGLKDQRLALKWVQENISHFGGDPNNITLFGESSGASSCHYQILSKESKGLFHKAILQSGCALSVLGLGRTNVIEIAETMGYKVNSEKEAFDILEKAPVEDIHLAQEKNSKFTFPSYKRIVSPMIEPEDSSSPIITQSATGIIQSSQYNDIPCIIGYNADEGSILSADIISNYAKEGNFKYFLPYHMSIDRNSEIATQLGEKLRQRYLGNDEDNGSGLQKLAGESMFITWILATIRQHVLTSKQSIFAYKMTLDTKLNVNKQRGHDVQGCAHADDLGYIFTTSNTPEIEKDSVEDISWRRVVKLWTNFAKYGNPTPDHEEFGVVWDPVKSADNIETFIIGNELKMKTNPNKDTIEFWKSILKHCSNTADWL